MNDNLRIPKQFLGAFKAGHRPAARQFIDEEHSFELLRKIYDSNWTDQESIKALAWLTKFNNEYHKNVIKKGDTNALHNTDTLRKGLYARENAKNGDIMSAKVHNVESMQDKYEEIVNKNNTFNYEDMLIEMIDHQDEWQTLIEQTDKMDDKQLSKMLKNKKVSKRNGKENN